MMKITEYSKNRLLETFARWEVPRDYADPLYNYLVYGFSPGGFFTALLANDAMGAIARSHPANPMHELKKVVGWIQEYCPKMAWGDYQTVFAWTDMQEGLRRDVLEQCKLVYSAEDEIMLVLKNQRTVEPHLW